jgi:hypothetical protein
MTHNSNLSFHNDDTPINSRFIRNSLGQDDDDDQNRNEIEEQPPPDFEHISATKKKFPFLRKGQGYVATKYQSTKRSKMPTDRSNVNGAAAKRTRKPFTHMMRQSAMQSDHRLVTVFRLCLEHFFVCSNHRRVRPPTADMRTLINDVRLSSVRRQSLLQIIRVNEHRLDFHFRITATYCIITIILRHRHRRRRAISNSSNALYDVFHSFIIYTFTD